MMVPVALCLAMTGAGEAAAAPGPGGGEARSQVCGPGELSIQLRPGAGPVERRAAEVLADRIAERTGLSVPVAAAHPARRAIELAVVASGGDPHAVGHPGADPLGPDGFCLDTVPDASGRVYVIGQSPAGLVAGVGKLLRLMRYDAGRLTIPEVRLTDTPALAVRGMYFATHFGNFYDVAPLEEVDRVIEDLALWGLNQLVVWFDMHHFQSFQDPAAQQHLARLQHFAQTAHGLGMRFGLTFIANEGYGGSPVELRAAPAPGYYGVELCPSKPEGLALIGKWQAEVLSAFPQVDLIWTWPYDQGGCGCEQCRPWGANGFLKASEQLARLYHERFPAGDVWLSTWLLDFWPGTGEEYPGLFRYIREREPQWFAGIIEGTHGDAVPAPLLERPFPERYSLACFPEISMYQMSPWGEHGANPLPGFCSRLAANVRGRVVGGWPYSEGIYEDLNKVFWARFYWNPAEATDDALGEYAAYYLGPRVRAQAVRLFHLLEQDHERNGWSVHNLSRAAEAWALAQRVDARLAPWARSSWRWRLLFIRAAVDNILATEGALSPAAHAALQPLCDELVGIYHAQDTFIRPPELPPPPDPRNLACGRPVTASSTLAGYEGSERSLTDWVRAQDDPRNFWVHDPNREPTAWVTVDLGREAQVEAVRLQFREIYGVFWFVPQDLAIEVSTDGGEFVTVLQTRDVPVEGTPYSPDFRSYPVGRPGRYVRIRLGPSQHTGDQYAGTLELTEVEVLGD